MKQNQQITKGITKALLVLLILTGSILGKEVLTNQKKINGKVSKSKILESFKLDPTFKKYFKNAKNPNLDGLLKSQVSEARIDSMVSTTYDTTFQKVKNTYQYDANGYLTNYLVQYYDEGQLVYGENMNMEFRSDGQFKSSSSMSLENGVWVNGTKETHTFDPSGNESSALYERWDTTLTSWVNRTKYEYSYDSNHNLLSDAEANWSSGVWENNEKYEWIYDGNNNQTSEVRKNWSSGAWENYNKHEWSYDSNNNETLDIYYRWNLGDWKKSSKKTNTYDGNNNLISYNSFYWSSATSTWENEFWTLYTYDANNNKIFDNEKVWDNGTTSWVDNERTNISYNANGKLLNELYEDYDGSIWLKDYEYTLTYDANDNVTTYINNDSWNGSDWEEKEKFNFRYNSSGNCNGGTFETWFANHWVSADAPWAMFLPIIFNIDYNEFSIADEYAWWTSFIPGYEYSVYYEGVTDVKTDNISPTSYNLEQNYPNPFNPSTKISYQIPSAGHVSLKIYDILGNEVTTLVNKSQTIGAYDVSFNASNLTSGIYFYQIISGEFSQVHKMMLIK